MGALILQTHDLFFKFCGDCSVIVLGNYFLVFLFSYLLIEQLFYFHASTNWTSKIPHQKAFIYRTDVCDTFVLSKLYRRRNSQIKTPHANSTFAVYSLLLQFLLLFLFNKYQIKFCFENSVVSSKMEISALSRISALTNDTCADIHNECTTFPCDQRCAG